MRKELVGVTRDGKEQNAPSDIMSVKFPIVTTMAIALMANVSVPEAIQANFVSKVSNIVDGKSVINTNLTKFNWRTRAQINQVEFCEPSSGLELVLACT